MDMCKLGTFQTLKRFAINTGWTVTCDNCDGRINSATQKGVIDQAIAQKWEISRTEGGCNFLYCNHCLKRWRS